MSVEIYAFDKSIHERLTEYNNILLVETRTVPASDIKSEWSNYIEIVIEPIGWQALWKIPRLTCEGFEIRYPTIVLVETESVDFSELSATVKVTAVLDDIHLPEKCDVPLIELYPTIDQKNNVLDVLGTATCIDQLRFFYNHLWMPWDASDDDHMDWVDNHLEIRIRLYFDMKKSIVNAQTCDIIRSLVKEGKGIEKKIEILEAILSEDEEPHDGIVDETCQLMQHHLRLQQIKAEMEVLENPAMRDILAKNHKRYIEKRRSENRKNICYFVWFGGTAKELQDISNMIQTLISEDITIKVSVSLEKALLISETDDIILLGKGNHIIKTVGGLEEGGTIKGIYSAEQTFVCLKEAEDGPALFDFSGTKVLLENISLDLNEAAVGVIVRKGSLNIRNCKICLSDQSTTKLGIVVLPGAKLTMEKTLFEGLGTALAVYATGEVVMNECTFKKCVDGIQLSDDVHVTITNCSFEDSKEYGIRLETHKYLPASENKSGSLELINEISELSVNECRFVNSGKANIALKSKDIVTLSTKQDIAS